MTSYRRQKSLQTEKHSDEQQQPQESPDDDPLTKYKKLQDLQIAHLDHLETIRSTLSQHGVNPDGFQHLYGPVPEVLHEAASQWAKLKQIFKRFDENHDGYWTYYDFRNYLAALGRLEVADASNAVNVLTYKESWMMWVSDVLNPIDDSKKRTGLMNFDAFIEYHRLVQKTYSLDADLESLNMSTLDPSIEKYRKCRDIFSSFTTSSSSKSVHVSNLQHLLYECGETSTCEHLLNDWSKVHRAKQEAMSFIRRQKKKAIRLFGCYQQSTTDTTQPDWIAKDEFLAWLFSSRPADLLPKFQKSILNFKLGLHRAMRHLSNYTKHFLAPVLHRAVFDYDMLSEKNLQSMSLEDEDKGRYTAALEIKAPASHPAAGISITYSDEVDAGTTLHELDYNTHDSEHVAHAFIMIDVACHHDITPTHATQVVKALHTLLDNLDERHIFPGYIRTVVSVPSKVHLESHHYGIVRIMILLNETCDAIHFFSDYLHLPLCVQVNTLVSKFVATFELSHTLRDLLEKQRLVIGNDVGVSATCDVEVGRTLIATLCDTVSSVYETTKLEDQESSWSSKVFASWSKFLTETKALELALKFRSLQEFFTSGSYLHAALCPQHIKSQLLQVLSTPGGLVSWWETNVARAIKTEILASSAADVCEAYETLQRHALGVHTIRMQSGVHEVYVKVDGLHFMEHLPSLLDDDDI